MRLNFRRTIGRAVSLAGISSLLLATGAIYGNAQSSNTWEATYEYNGEDVGRGVVLLDDNTVVAAGETDSDAGPDTDIYVVKTDGCYTALWENYYDIGGNDKVGRIRSTADGGFIIVGTTQNLNPVYCETRDDIFLLKLNGSGGVQWRRVYGGIDIEEGFDVKVANDGYVVAGSTMSYGFGQRDAYLIKTDLLGNRIWSQAYGGSETDFFKTCLIASNGDIVAAGGTYSYTSHADIFLVRVAQATGNPIWAKHLGRDGGDWANSVVEDFGGDLILAGGTTSGLVEREAFLLRTSNTGFPSVYNIFNGLGVVNAYDEFTDMQIDIGAASFLVVGTFEDNANGFGGNDVFMGVADPYLNFASTRLHGGSLDDQGFGVSGYTNNGTYEFVGVGLSESFGNIPPDLYMIRQSFNGMDNCYNYEPSMDQYLSWIEWEEIDLDHVRVGADCEPPMVAGSQHPGQQPICYWCGGDQGNIPDSPDGDNPSVSSVDAPGAGSAAEMRIYPNPVTSQRTLVLEHRPAGDVMMTVSVSDITGKLVATGQHPASAGRMEIDTEGWAAGTYLVRMTIGGTTESRVVTVLDN